MINNIFCVNGSPGSSSSPAGVGVGASPARGPSLRVSRAGLPSLDALDPTWTGVRVPAGLGTSSRRAPSAGGTPAVPSAGGPALAPSSW